MAGRLDARIVREVRPADATPREVQRAVDALLADGCRIRPAGTARARPAELLRRYPPRSALRLFDASF